MDALAVICIGRAADALGSVNHFGVELAAWQRDPEVGTGVSRLVLDLLAGYERHPRT